jgi:hypothetical protein
MTRDPVRARAPWAEAGQSADPRLRALSYAILAPNPHNLQPWLAELRGEDGLAIWRDPARRLPETDPFDRQLTIGMGCFLELLVLAAAAEGLAAEIALFPQGDTGPVAEITFRPGGVADPLFAHALARRSTKEPFADRPVPPAAAAALAQHATIVTDSAEVAALRDLTWRAWMIEAETPRTYRESVDLMRFGRAEIEANPDGIDLGGPFLETLMLAGLMTREAQLDSGSEAFRQGVELYRGMLAATPAYAYVTTQSNARADQIAAGRRWLRLNLAVTGLGLALHPVSQALQEYPEMAGPHAEVHSLLAAPGETVQLLGRIGFGPQVPPSPRWPLATRMKDA